MVVAVTAHWLDRDWQLRHRCLAVEPFPGHHTAAHIGAKIAEVMSRYGVEPHRWSSVTYDTVAANVAAVRDHVRALSPDCQGIECQAHVTNLTVRDAEKILDDGDESFSKRCRKVVHYFHASNLATESLANKQKVREGRTRALVIDRFGSTLRMFESLHRSRVFIGEVYNEQRRDQPLSMIDWDLLPWLIRSLKPFDEYSVEMGGQSYVTLAHAVPCITELFNLEIDDSAPDLARRFHRALYKAADRRMSGIEEAQGLACILDARVHWLTFLRVSSREQCRSWLRERYAKALAATEAARARVLLAQQTGEWAKKLHAATEAEATVAVAHAPRLPDVPPPASPAPAPPAASPATPKARVAPVSLWQRAVSVRSAESAPADEVERYLAMPQVDLERYPSPLDWWRTAGATMFPVLATEAMRWLAIPASSLPCERIFSTAGNVITKKRVRLEKSRAGDLIYLHENIDVVQEELFARERAFHFVSTVPTS